MNKTIPSLEPIDLPKKGQRLVYRTTYYSVFPQAQMFCMPICCRPCMRRDPIYASPEKVTHTCTLIKIKHGFTMVQIHGTTMVWYCMVFWPRYFHGITMVQYHGIQTYHGTVPRPKYDGNTVPWYYHGTVPRPKYHGNTVQVCITEISKPNIHEVAYMYLVLGKLVTISPRKHI